MTYPTTLSRANELVFNFTLVGYHNLPVLSIAIVPKNYSARPRPTQPYTLLAA
jgi:hypothetical protein